jgi:hypothetical protein
VTNTIINRGRPPSTQKVRYRNAWISSSDSRFKARFEYSSPRTVASKPSAVLRATLGKPFESLGNPLEDLDEVSVFGKFKFSLKHSGCLQPFMANTD